MDTPEAGPGTLRGDNPIRRPEDDALERAPVARGFAQQVLGLDTSEGVVVGVLGPWGSGKTSFVNLARPEFERAGVPIIDFNPWMFSGAQQLVESFFVELSAQLKLRPGLAQIGADLETYGELFSGLGWLPIVGSWIERLHIAMKFLGKSLERRREGIGARRSKLEKALAKLEKPIVVFLDDIDRLSTAEIRDIFKLVRLTASFPNLLYIVAFDRKRVEDALNEQGVSGRDYLEKILQVATDLPVVPSEVLARQVFSEVDNALSSVDKTGPFNEQAWSDIFPEIVQPLIHNMRDVRRYAAAVKGALIALEGQVNLTDVLALEAVRVFLPDVSVQLQGAVAGLTTTSGLDWGNRDSPELKSEVNRLIESGRSKPKVVSALIDRVFPAAQRHTGGSHYGADWKSRWIKERRVAHEDILRFYLERVAGQGLRNFRDAEQAWARIADGHVFEKYLRSVDINRLEDVISGLEAYENQFRPEHVIPGTAVLLNLLPDLPERPLGMLGVPTRLIVARIVLRLVRSLKDPATIEAAVQQILPKLNSLSSKLELLTLIGHREGAGHKLVSEAAGTNFQKTWRDEVRACAQQKLVQERDVVAVLFRAKHEAKPGESPLMIQDSPELTLALLRAARREVFRQTLGNRAVRRAPRLDWDALVQIYGDEQTLRKAVETLRATHPEGIDDLRELADKYAGGWRPKTLDEDF